MYTRHIAPPELACTPRTSLDPKHYPTTDAVMKDLKTCSRRLQIVLSSYGDDLRILDRLYYKSKNQHRMALYFKRVSEIRRYAQRLTDMNVLDTVETLRAAFFGVTSSKDQKSTRAAWNHVPNARYVAFVSERLAACSALILKMYERLLEAYRHFALAMQSGAFIQLILLFAGITSRMLALVHELEDALQTGASICRRILDIIDPNHTHKVRCASTQSLEPAKAFVHIVNTPVIDPDVVLEDLGDTVTRLIHTDTPKDSSRPSEGLSMDDIIIVGAAVPSVAPEANGVNLPPVKVTVKRKNGSEKRPKKERRRNEIDDIFGF
ncbi:hypothetical protein BV22DRAFT_1027976 [Leucogyrophana mollusca]|uniref:Uncharacterized protein n=1 Tax=Leucogyrophana mollusca TaxID=85980 RepID=A0ACB8BZ66_9AGAM|nr:hypothetical protein BV22DRAFT_1027976 [Leucogyrophana mollusca]